MASSSVPQCVRRRPNVGLRSLRLVYCFPSHSSIPCRLPHRFKNSLLFLKFLNSKYKNFSEKEYSQMILKHRFLGFQKNYVWVYLSHRLHRNIFCTKKFLIYLKFNNNNNNIIIIIIMWAKACKHRKKNLRI